MHDRLSAQGDWGPGARFIVVLAGAVVVIAGLRGGAPILLPAAVALFLAILTLPIMLWLQRRGVPAPLALVMAILVDVAIFGGIVLLVSQSVADFQGSLQIYANRLQIRFDGWLEWLEARNVPAREYIDEEFFSATTIMNFIQGFFGRVAAFLSNAFLVVLIMIFMLAEASIFPQKFRTILGDGDGEMGRFSKITGEVLEYLAIKTLVSVATGVSIGLWAWIMGLDFPILLGLIGFLLNYVPTIGSVIAAIPAILLAILQGGGVGMVSVVALGYLVINIVFGNLIEPQLLGRRLGLSTLVVILSLIFWAWAWGPVGALLAVPLTMVVKIMLEHTQDLRWVAVLLDKEAPRSLEPSPAAVDQDEGI